MTQSHRYPGRLALAALMALSIHSAAAQDSPPPKDPGQHLYEAACASCHYRGAERAPFGKRSPLADGRPDDLAQYILFGAAPEEGEGGMPGFGPVLTDGDVSQLVIWLRATSQPDDPWPDVAARVAQMRVSGEREE